MHSKFGNLLSTQYSIHIKHKKGRILKINRLSCLLRMKTELSGLGLRKISRGSSVTMECILKYACNSNSKSQKSWNMKEWEVWNNLELGDKSGIWNEDGRYRRGKVKSIEFRSYFVISVGGAFEVDRQEVYGITFWMAPSGIVEWGGENEIHVTTGYARLFHFIL